MWYSENWKEYELLDCSDGQRLERWGEYTLIRPDPQVIWKDVKRHPAWKKADASYKRSSGGGGAWNENKLPEEWILPYESLGMNFCVRPMGFKHTGVFPEQAVKIHDGLFYVFLNDSVVFRDAYAFTGKDC